MLRFSLLGSGSSGNAALVVSPRTKVLIDNGLSFRQLEARVSAIGSSLEGLDAVFVTHEHGDHVHGLGTLARRLDVPVFMTEETFRSLPPGVGKLPRIETFEAGDTVRVADLEVSSFSIAHDAADPVSFTIACDGAKLGLAIDVGHVSQLVRNRLSRCHALVLESNYCPDMLMQGSYPPQVQQRIRGRLGHMSNYDMTSLLNTLLHDALKLVVLVHISERNNHPDLVRRLAQQVLAKRPAMLHLATQNEPTKLFEVCP
ncbi:MAG: MBL fold metallo-hydrolase [Candidatus Hydrogenedentes bacterium]|nr:MBL fold metallo-hydrolase [Candidatus Hydrogenedentota bacterium]MBI3119442.1 MBL fold metallo-hydrolase [Candidatus Hydrogenedentota bacterium]